MADVLQFPTEKSGPPEFMIGPFQEYRVLLEGKLIPKLTAYHDGDGIGLVVDNRLSITVPKERAYDVAWLVANALAVGAGFACITSEKKTEAFAPNCAQLNLEK